LRAATATEEEGKIALNSNRLIAIHVRQKPPRPSIATKKLFVVLSAFVTIESLMNEKKPSLKRQLTCFI